MTRVVVAIRRETRRLFCTRAQDSDVTGRDGLARNPASGNLLPLKALATAAELWRRPGGLCRTGGR